MFAFVTKLNNLEKLEAKASELRKKSGDAIVINQPSINGVAIPVEKPADPEITAHNEQIRALKSAIDEFNRTRAEFLKTFIARYMNPQPVRVDPTPWTRGPQRPAWDDMFSQSIRDSIRGAKPTRADTPDVQVWRNQIAWAVASALGIKNQNNQETKKV